MEDNIENNNAPDEYKGKLKFNFEIQEHLYQAAKWGKLLSIVGFIFVALLVFFALAIGEIIKFLKDFSPVVNSFPAKGLTITYSIMALIGFFSNLYLFQFSNKIKQSILNHDEFKLTGAFRNLKSLLKFWGILTLIVLILYLIIVAALIIGGVNIMNTLKQLK